MSSFTIPNRPVPIVPTGNPDEPYGLDSNGRPIKAISSDSRIAADLLTHADLAPGECIHRNDPANCILCGTEIKNRDRIPTPPSGPEIGYFLPGIAAAPVRRHIPPYGEILGLSTGVIANWRDRVIYIEDKTVDDSPVLKDSTPLKDEIAALKETRKEAELLFKSMSSSYQKHHREPDNRLDPKTRNAYKREAKKTIADCDTKLVDRRRRLSRWADTPENWTKTTKTIKVEWKFSECLREPCTREDYEKKWADCIDAVPDETKPEIVAAQRTWVQRENDIIRLAIKAGLCRPSESIIRMYPQLLIKAIKDRTKGRGQDYQDLAENKLIDKESGSSIGTTTVHSGGYYYNLKNSLGRIRPFESFDKSARRSGSKLNDQEPEGLDSGDYSERDGNE